MRPFSNWTRCRIQIGIFGKKSSMGTRFTGRTMLFFLTCVLPFHELNCQTLSLRSPDAPGGVHQSSNSAQTTPNSAATKSQKTEGPPSDQGSVDSSTQRTSVATITLEDAIRLSSAQ